VKILDPACGSGAYPMGVLQKIIYLLQKVDLNSEIWLENQLSLVSNELAEHIVKKYEKSNFNYLRKLGIIRECIFGVDIQPIATEISRLRCFLTLIVDEIVEDNLDNRGIETLPNLDFKFVTANSLLSLSDEIDLFDDEDLINELRVTRNKYFNATGDARIDYQSKFIELQTKLKESVDSQDVEYSSQRIKQLIEWNPFMDGKVDWLDTNWMFGVDLFDIIIENPPYVSTKDIGDDREQIRSKYGFIDDLYNHFFHRSIELLKPEGVLAVISSDTYFTIESKRNLREKLLNYFIHEIVHLGYGVFDLVLVSTAIIILQNSKQENSNVTVIDAKNNKNLLIPTSYNVEQSLFSSTINKAFFIPNVSNLQIHEKLSPVYNQLDNSFGNYIKSSTTIKKFTQYLTDYRDNLKEGDVTLIGLITKGGQGLATANNGKFVGVIEGTKEAENIKSSRVEKISIFNANYNLDVKLPKDEVKIWQLFDTLKEKYGRDVFGQGYLYRIVSKRLICDILSIDDDEKLNGIESIKPYFVPYEKGDKDGNRWYLDNPYVIDWSKQSVSFLKSNSGKKGVGMPVVRNLDFYFKEGFCYSDINTHYIKARIKPISVHDVKSMSLFSVSSTIPDYYLITILNSDLIADLVDNFINNTQTFQINDCRSIPIPVPSNDQLTLVKLLFDQAVECQKSYFRGDVPLDQNLENLKEIQDKVNKAVMNLYSI
jgi:hypothetical protein